MSDTAAVTETVAAPVADAAAAAPAPVAPTAAPEAAAPVEAPAAPQQPTGPLSKREAREAARQQTRERFAKPAETVSATVSATDSPVGESAVPAAEAAAVTPVIDGKGLPHDPATGQFIPKEAADIGGAVPDAVAAETRAPDTAADATAAPAATTIRIELPQGHAIREMGLDAVTASTPAEEQALRALVNGYTRRQEVVAKDTQIAELQQKLLERDATDAAREKWKQTPEYPKHVERYHNIADAEGPEAAALYWKAASEAGFGPLAATEIATRRAALDAEQVTRDAEAWKNEAWQNAGRLPAEVRSLPEFRQWFDAAYNTFNAELDMGNYPQYDSAEFQAKPADERKELLHKEFTKQLGARLIAQPAVRTVFARRDEAERRTAAEKRAAADAEARRIAAAEAAGAEKLRLEAANRRTATPPHPLGALNGAARSDVTGTTEAPPAADPNLSPNAFRREQKLAAREAARARLLQR